MTNEKGIRLFGRVSVRASERETDDFTTTHARNLLVFLAMHADIDHPRDRLVEALWPDKIDGSARNRLSVTLYHVNRALEQLDDGMGQAIVSMRTSVRLDSAVAPVDLHQFRTNVALARTTRDTDERRELYRLAFDLYRGPLVPDLVRDWTLTRQIESSQMFQEAAVWLAIDLDTAGRNVEAQALLSSALDREPYSERAAELLTAWYIQSGKYEYAVACAKRLRRALASHGQPLSAGMLERIDELNLVIASKSRTVIFADESVMTLLIVEGVPSSEFDDAVRANKGQVSSDGSYGLFTNPLMAMEAANEIAKRRPMAKGLLHTTIMSENDAVPPPIANGLAVLERRGVYGSEAFACLVKERSAEAVKRVSGASKIWALT